MPLSLMLLVTCCVFLIGFAVQRGTICAVAASMDLIEKRDARRLLGFLLGALWILGLLTVLRWTGFETRPSLPNFAVTALTAAAALLYGLGAVLNGACALGALARLGSGRLGYALLFPAWYAGIFIADRIADFMPDLRPVAIGQDGPWMVPGYGELAALTLLLPAIALLWSRGRILHPARTWHPQTAVGVIALASAVVAILLGPWSFTLWLQDMATSGEMPDPHAGTRIILLGALLTGAFASALVGPHGLRLDLSRRDAGRSLLGGTIMGIASSFIPFGNDLLLLFGLPLLLAFAWVAYAVMLAGIMLILVVMKPR